RPAAVAAFALLAMAEHACGLEHGFPVREVGCSAGARRERQQRAACRHGLESAVEREQPHAVTARAARELVAGRVSDDVLLAVVLERAGRRVHARAGLELP